MWHLGIEKALKGYITYIDKDVPYIHNLYKLATYAGLSISDKDELDEISSFNLEARYDEYKYKLYKKANKEYTNKWIVKCKEIHRIVMSKIHL